MTAGQVGVLLVDEVVNPAFSLPASVGFAAAMAKVDLAVALGSHPDETAASAKLVLPTNDALEDWGHEEPLAGLHVIRQPGGIALWDTRSLGEILLATWRALDTTAPAGTWREYVQAAIWATRGPAAPAPAPAPEGAPAAPPAPTSADLRWWESCLAAGFTATPGWETRTAPEVSGSPIAWSGAAPMAGSGDYALHSFPHDFLADGRYANQPWAQEVPDPMTGQVWDTWALIHPTTAQKLGVADNAAITLTSEVGAITVGVEISPSVRADVIAVPFGNGHTDAAGRYAKYGASPVSVLGVVKDTHGAMAWQQVKVRAAAAGTKATLTSTFGGDSDNDRKFVALASAQQLGTVGDRDSGHATITKGDMVLDVHEPAGDPRLEKAGLTDFYPMPDHPNYRFGMTIDTNACTGCGACAVACYAENNLAVVGKVKMGEGREMGWLRVNRYWKPEYGDDGAVLKEQAYFVPMLCQHCAHAPCESVCPVWATYHSVDGLNAMVYNRCVGTRYCSNACPYSVRRFNYHGYQWPEPFNLMLNPDVSTRSMGVMEKCTFCVQRIRRTKIAWKDHGHTDLVPDEQLQRLPACVDACPSNALVFGNLNDPASAVSRARTSGRSYFPIFELNTMPAINYLARATHHRGPASHHGGAEGASHEPASNEHPAPAPEGH
jgi:molybdopterin-containing oxidoreductase family iron-sulfur binding subunit